MTCHELAKRLAELQPDLGPIDIARICLMILSNCHDREQLRDDQVLMAEWKGSMFRLEAASDQHAAVAAELDTMCGDGPSRFSPDQRWILLRAVKVQSQILELYSGEPSFTE